MINEKLNTLFDEWKTIMNRNGDKGFCYDGLIYRGGKEDSLWLQSNRRIVFLLKEQNDNDGEDVREWTGSINGLTPNGNFFNRISAWLYGLTHVTASGYPSMNEAFNTEIQMKVLSEYPYAYVNIKKETGTAIANDSIVYDHAVRYASFLRQELDILSPNIIVCGGVIVFRAAIEVVYPDVSFQEINDWMYYASSIRVFLINSYHPAAHKSNDVMYEEMMKNIKESSIMYLIFNNNEL